MGATTHSGLGLGVGKAAASATAAVACSVAGLEVGVGGLETVGEATAAAGVSVATATGNGVCAQAASRGISPMQAAMIRYRFIQRSSFPSPGLHAHEPGRDLPTP